VLEVSHRSAFGFELAVPLPEQVGADRLVNAEAAIAKYGAPAVVVDSGTATTWCAIDARRRYLGGAIAPGISVSTDALFQRASKLASVELKLPPTVIGNTTETALQSGIVNGYVALLDGMVARIKEELGEPQARTIGTGGWMELLGKASKQIQVVDPQLTLDGLYCLWRRAQGKPVEPGGFATAD
jgi:type III pantothenate kinase